MIRVFVKHQKKIATFFFAVFFVNLVAPLTASGITSGPSQPVMQGFQAIGSDDMVDLFSGDFKYNIPLMDVGGYPLNIHYAGGITMDQEASWVGLGWNISPGTI